MTTAPLLDIDMREVQALQRELRAVSKDFSNAMQNELRKPVQRATSDFKFAARGQLGRFGSDAAAEIRSSSSTRSGYAIKREGNKKGSRFTQHGYTNATGNVRHPLFGNKKYWYDTALPGATGWWDLMYRQAVPRAADEFTKAMLKILDRLSTGNLSTSRYVGGGGRSKASLDTFGPQLPGA